MNSTVLLVLVIFIGIIFLALITVAVILIVRRIRRFKFKSEDDYAGFLYDEKQDIFYSDLNSWQRNFGYCQMYDDLAAPFSMIFDLERIIFNYDNKKWLIELWKGQYGMTTGGEVGVYTTKNMSSDLFQSAKDEDMLELSFDLIKHGRILFRRSDRHWWLTGFILGMFSEPKELKMQIKIMFPTVEMCDAFTQEIIKLGYNSQNFVCFGQSVAIIFDKPYTKQSSTRAEFTDYITQRKNQFLCEEYLRLTSEVEGSINKINYLKDHNFSLYTKAISIGRPLKLYNKKKVKS